MQKSVAVSTMREFNAKRMCHWDRISRKKENPNRFSAFYHQLLRHYCSFFISPGLRVLELGCSHGEGPWPACMPPSNWACPG